MSYASSLVVDIPSFKYKSGFRNIVGQLQDSLTLGSVQNPEPIGYTMLVISDMLDNSHWQNIDDYKKRGLCPPSAEAALALIKTNLEKAVTEYAGLAGASTPVCK